jgi:hypothetical protein
MRRGMVTALGIFSALLVSTFVLQSSMSQLPPPAGTTPPAPVTPPAGTTVPPTAGTNVSTAGEFIFVCLYAGAEYSPGSVLNMPDGIKTCSSDGVWVS